MTDTHAHTAKTQQIPETKDVNSLRRIMDKTIFYKIINANIYKESYMQRIGECVLGRRIEWSDHISRMSPCQLVLLVISNGR